MFFVRFAFTLLLAAASFAAETVPGAPAAGMVVHEWGTFTSVAAADGKSIPWTVLADDGDLPCFVEHSQVIFKFQMQARVRMETPVLYFYTPRAAKVSVGVDFPHGALTEWYPPAEQSNPRRLDWNNAEVLPGDAAEFPRSQGPSHYFAARATDAASVRVYGKPEKFLFYRGIGDFEPPLAPRFAADGAVELGKPLPAILFENRGGRMGFRIVEGARVAPPELTGSVDEIGAALVTLLTDGGLYEKEARAMVATWRDSWFEEGMRLLYIVPRETVDSLLPLNINPKPQAVERVFVGRMELISPAIRETIGTALANRDEATLRRYGRFLNAFATEISSDSRTTQFVQSLGTPRRGPCVR
jgi:hypothetical protein